MNDKIHITNLRVRGNIGVADWEKKSRQDLVVNITIEHDQRKAAASDDVKDTVDYRSIRDQVVELIEKTPHELLERLAEEIAALVLSINGVLGAHVHVEKPGALRFADAVAVEIHRSA